jgi:hypothetical protein
MDHQEKSVGLTEHSTASEAPDLVCYGRMVADGEIPFPTDLSPGNLQQLARQVAHRRRTRLVRFIACAIAADIDRGRKPKPKEVLT